LALLCARFGLSLRQLLAGYQPTMQLTG